MIDRELVGCVYGHVVLPYFDALALLISQHLNLKFLIARMLSSLVCFVCFALFTYWGSFYYEVAKNSNNIFTVLCLAFLNNCSKTGIPKASRLYFTSKIILGTSSYHRKRATSPGFRFGRSRLSLCVRL